jgi:hypothetical protein
VRSFIVCTHPQISLADQVKENEVGGACGTHGRGEKSERVFVGKVRRKETTRKTEGGLYQNGSFGDWFGCGAD